MSSRTGIPLTLYDIFGYLIPGAIFCVAIVLVIDADHLGRVVVDLNKIASEQAYKPDYIIGFALAFLRYSPIAGFTLILLVFYIAGHIVATFSSLFFERLFVRYCLGFPCENMLSLDGKRCFLYPDYTKPFEKEFRDVLINSLKQHFGLKKTSAKDLWHLSFVAVEDSHPAVFSRAIHFLTLYGFHRNMSMCVIMIAIVTCLASTVALSTKLILVPMLVIVSWGFFWQYLKALRRMTDEVLRTMYYFHRYKEDFRPVTTQTQAYPYVSYDSG
jgi:hypothetical protein